MKKLKSLSILFVGLTLLTTVACSATRTQKTAGEQIDDTVTLAKVKSALIGDPVTKAYEIDVDVFRGIVQLNGFVDTPVERTAATEVSRKVAGVKDVRNNLGVKTAPNTVEQAIDDATLTANVKSALIESPDTKAHQINVDSSGGVVRLSGFVNSASSKHAATFLARGVTGVKSVRNDIDVK